ncbi:UNVERIFIED_CONTAM: Polyadenylate-binding protein-interacting protein 11 [Sesamum calycinum]|uniref:Polyadenylate-binding protein-interacting protein 11 n=1 Tax=Sesamum calycinum TaxID=2727403 RepID=A0AAW2LZJ8_9LAMI
MVVLMENGSSREAKDDSSTSVNVHQFQAAFHSQARISMKQNDHDHNQQRPTSGNGGDEVFKREMMELEELFSKLNPMAREFVPPSFANTSMPMKIKLDGGYSAKSTAAADVMHLNGFSNNDGNMGRRGKKNGHHPAKRRTNSRTSMAQREEVIRRTVYVSDVDHQITEEHLAALFLGCGQVVDCRICGPEFPFFVSLLLSSLMRELCWDITREGAASRTAIAPVNPTFLPRTLDEREMCSRTVYVTNIDKKVSQADVKLFFETICGKVYRLRLLGDYHHSSRIAFVEFAVAESAIAALNCSGVVLGMLPIRVSPSKTPVRPRTPRPPSQ